MQPASALCVRGSLIPSLPSQAPCAKQSATALLTKAIVCERGGDQGAVSMKNLNSHCKRTRKASSAGVKHVICPG
jgi:hypothetical protein